MSQHSTECELRASPKEAMKHYRGTHSSAIMVMSIDSRQFSREYLSWCIPYILRRHKDMNLVIADDLMVYNRLSAHGDPNSTNSLLQSYWPERHAFAQGVVEKLDIDHRNISIKAYGDYCNGDFLMLLRRFTMIVFTDDRLLQCLHNGAGEFLESRDFHEKPSYRNAKLLASMGYQLEETAWTIHLASKYHFTDNYYPGALCQLLFEFYSHPSCEKFLSLMNVPRHVHRVWKLENNPSSSSEPDLLMESNL